MNFALTRNLIIFGLVLPLAALVGFVLATPADYKTLFVIGVVLCVLMIPAMLRWYHPVLIFTLNAFVNIFFLPGKPQLWMLCAAVGFGIAILNRAMNREMRFITVPAITYPLLFFLAVVLVTAKLTGGLGTRALGGQTYGGKGYFYIIFAVVAYFVITSKVIEPKKVRNYLSIHFLSGTTALLSHMAYMLGPGFYFLFFLFPVDFAISQAMADWNPTVEVARVTGLGVAGGAVYFFLMLRFGIRGIFDPLHPWRLPCLVSTVIVSLFGGYRAALITYLVQFVIQFYFERLVRTRLCVILIVGSVVASCVALPFVHKMPLSIQRCVSFIPGVPVTAAAKADAESSTRWRIEMWQVMIPEIPKYLILGKGYALDPAALYLANQAVQRGLAQSYDVSATAGNYHSGPLSVIIPFGIFGAIGFLWLLGAGGWVLYRNYRYGEPSFRLVNTFMLAHFIMRTVMFFFVFGAVDSELIRFTGILGLSIAVNGGIRKPVHSTEPAPGMVLQPA